MDLITLKQSLRTDVWKITPNAAKVLDSKLDMLLKGVQLPTKAELSVDMPMEPMEPEEPEDEQPTCMVINCNGPIVKRLGFPREMVEFVGIQDLDFLDEDIISALDNPNLKTVLLRVNSGGGSVLGLIETGELLDELDKKVNLIAYTDTYMCSAAYQLASHCSTIYTSPSALIGMVGTYCQRMDISEYLKLNGIKLNTFGAGDYKTMYVEEEPLTDKQRDLFVSQIAQTTKEFQEIVLRKHTIAMEDLQGQIFEGREGVKKGFADGEINSEKQLMTFLGQL